MVEEQKEEEQRKLFGLLSQKAYFALVIAITLICGLVACVLLVIIIKTAGNNFQFCLYIGGSVAPSRAVPPPIYWRSVFLAVPRHHPNPYSFWKHF